jgi:CHASE3 domain sensor protein
MNEDESLTLIRYLVEYAAQHGQDVVQISIYDLFNLLNKLQGEHSSQEPESMRESNSELRLTYYKAQFESILAQYNALREASRESFRSVIQAGQAALKSAILINGGGAFALLAFLGHIWSTRPPGSMVALLPYSLLMFAFGVLFSAIASGTTYLSQSYYGRSTNELDKSQKQRYITVGNYINKLTIFIVIISYLLFLIAVFIAFNSLYYHFRSIQ